MPYRPKYGGTPQVAFERQFKKAPVNLLSLTVVLIELLANDGSDVIVSHGSGIMWRDERRFWLVTARHVLDGKNPFDGERLSEKGYEPERIRVHLTVGGPKAPRRVVAEYVIRDQQGMPAWAGDPDFADLRTDIACLPLDACGLEILCVNDDPDYGKNSDIFCRVGMQCFVVGYPTNHVEGLKLPLWRSATFASDPAVPIDNKPMFLVDASTGPGFSGSPVWRAHFGPTPFHDEKSPTGVRIESDQVMAFNFIGIYAGRLDHAHYGAQTPYVFYANRIPLILKSATSLPTICPVVPLT